MKPLRLQIAGLRSWTTEREVSFEGVELAAVIGPTGAGKSSILEAIVYALYNSATYERRAGSLISSDAKTMTVILDFLADSEQWRVTRAMSRGNYPPSVHKFACLTNPSEHPMVEGEQAVNVAIQELIGLTQDQFLTAVLLPQGRFQTLLMATPGVRSAILKGVFRLDELDEVRERAGRIRRDEIEPRLETRREERMLLLPDPEMTLVKATEEISRCTTKLGMLTEIKGRYDEAVERAARLRQEVLRGRERADGIEQASEATPTLDALLELDVELSSEEAEQQRLREAQLATRASAEAQLATEAQAGVTIEALVGVRHTIQRAKTDIPNLDAADARLNGGRESHAADQTALATAKQALTEERAAIATAEAAVLALAATAESARAALMDASEKLRVLRAAVTLRETATSQLRGFEQQVATAQAESLKAKEAAAVAKGAAEGAQSVFEAARTAHAAAHIAVGLEPGDPCPVCQRDIPDDFDAPEAPTVLASAEAEANRLRAAQEDAAADAAKAVAKSEALDRQATTAREAVAGAESEEASARTAAAASFTDMDSSKEDSELLATLTGAASHAAAAYEMARQEQTVKAADLAAEERAIEERARLLGDREEQLGQEATRIETEREAILNALAALPADFQLTSTAKAELDQVEETSSARLTELQAFDTAVRAATAEIEQIDGRIAVLRKTRADEIDAPRRDATGHAREIASKVREAHPSVKVPKQPTDGAALREHAKWVATIVELARATADSLRRQAAAGEASLEQAGTEAQGILKEAAKAAEHELASADEFQEELDLQRATLLAGERERDTAAEQIPKAAALDTSIAKLSRRRDALDELAASLGDGHFIKWLVERRQQLLLAVASEILAAMTGDRFRFAADFSIIDGRTGVGRQPSTLSGGESFMASLSLALGMAEIAARAGGRIGSLYLDEGFGTLDPNTLDEAITALELRARGGQMILIVSHVPAIAQRIDRVLQVRPDATGAMPEWLDDEDRDSLLLEAASAEVS